MSPVVIAVVLMLVLLFLKVPVWMSVIAGTASYFFRAGTDAAGGSLLCVRRYFYERLRCQQANHGPV